MDVTLKVSRESKIKQPENQQGEIIKQSAIPNEITN